jgi:hypothetical protein
MTEPNVVLTPCRTRDEIEGVIAANRVKIEEAERDLSAVAATLRLIELGDQREQFPPYRHKPALERGEVVNWCRRRARSRRPTGLDTRELALRVLARSR